MMLRLDPNGKHRVDERLNRLSKERLASRQGTPTRVVDFLHQLQGQVYLESEC